MSNKLSIENLREQIRELAQNDPRFTKKSSDAPGAVYSSVWVPNLNAPKNAGDSWTADIQGMDSKYYEVSFTVDANDKVVLGNDATEVQRNISYEVAAHAAASIIEMTSGALPTNLQWMPPGKHTVQPMGFSEPFEMTVTPEIANAADRQLQQMLDAHAAGTAAEPYIDINHEDKVRAFLPKKISWGGDDLKKGGVRVDGKWTGGGESAARNGEQSCISPSWTLHKITKAFLGIKRNLGGLVPASAFSSIQAFAKAGSGNQQPQQTQNMELKDITNAVTEALKPVITRLDTLEANAKDDGALGKRIIALETADTTMTQANAKATVEEIGVRAGRIGAQDKDTIEFWMQAVAKDSSAVHALKKMVVNPAFVQVVHAGGDNGGGSATLGEHEFIAKAKAHGETNKISDSLEAQMSFSRTADGKKLYEQYIESLAPRKK